MPTGHCAFSIAAPPGTSRFFSPPSLRTVRPLSAATIRANRRRASRSSPTALLKSSTRAASDSPTVLYFAYGSNLSPHALGPDAAIRARRVSLLSARRGALPGHRFVYFPTPLPAEPAVATILPVDDTDGGGGAGRVVHGMLYELSAADFAAVAGSEGVLPDFLPQPAVLPFAKVMTVRVRVYGEDLRGSGGEEEEYVLAKTFYWPSVRALARVFPESAPSKRYFGLIADGFRHYNLDEQFLPSATPGAPIGNVFKPEDTPTFGADSPAQPNRAAPSPSVAASSKAASSEAVEAAYEAMRADDEAFSLPEAPERNAVRLVNLTPRSEAGLQPRSILAYIPGIDGSGFSIISQLPNLVEAEQDIWAVRIPYGNRDNWEDLGRFILALVADAVSSTGAPSVVVLGESMGGAIAMQVAVENSRRTEPVAIEQLVMVNPASSFRRSELSRIWIELSSRVPPKAYKRLVGPLLLPFILDPSSIPLRELPTTGMQRLKKLRSFLSRASDLLPQGAVMHRLSLLNDFRLSPADYASIADGATRTRLLVAENDNLLPVVPDSSRLLRLVPGLERAVLQYGGHAMLQDNRVDLGELLFQKKKSADATGVASTYPDGELRTSSGLRERVLRSKWAAPDRDLLMLPTVTERALLARKFSRTRAFHSPVVVGTERLPHAGRGRPVLFISNHTLLGTIDAVLLMQHVLEHRNVLVRSLAHPLLFRTFDFRRRSEPRDEDESADEEKPRVLRLPGLDGVSASELKRFGIQSVNPRALVRELALNHWVLLFPGGAREALKRKSDDLYSLHWPESTEFVRVAAAMGAVIIPVATVGTEDSVNLLLDSEQVSNGVRAITKLRGTQSSGTSDDDRRQPLPVARQWRGATADADGESMLPPLAAPSAPDRVYLRFGSPIEVPVAAEEDRELARGVYADVKAAVREGIASLLVRRENDSYRTLRSRLAFRVKHGDGVEAPACPAWTWETVAGPVDE